MIPTIEKAQHASKSDALIGRLSKQRTLSTRSRLARRLTPTLLQWLHIQPDEIALVPWLADTRCRSNAEAVTLWIQRQLEGPELAMETFGSRRLVATLAARLQRELLAFEEAL